MFRHREHFLPSKLWHMAQESSVFIFVVVSEAEVPDMLVSELREVSVETRIEWRGSKVVWNLPHSGLLNVGGMMGIKPIFCHRSRRN